MSKNEAKEFAKRFIEEQKRILESYGDTVVRAKYNDAVNGAQRTFETISKPNPFTRPPLAHERK